LNQNSQHNLSTPFEHSLNYITSDIKTTKGILKMCNTLKLHSIIFNSQAYIQRNLGRTVTVLSWALIVKDLLNS